MLPRSSARPGGGTVPWGIVPVPAESKWTIDSVGGGHRRAATAGGAGEAEPVLLRLSLILIYRKKECFNTQTWEHEGQTVVGRFAAAPWHSRVQPLPAKQVLPDRRCAGWVSCTVGAGVTSGSQEKTPLLSPSFQ